MRILVTGSDGQLGTEVLRCLETGHAEIGPVPAAYVGAQVDACSHAALDIADTDAVNDWFAARGPYDLVINCAAMTDVDACEADEALAWAVNAAGPGNLARAAGTCGAKLIHLSTDYVFPGKDPRPLVETDEPAPLSAYGRSKLAGERRVLANWERSFVVRTAWLYGYAGNNFAKTVMRLARENGKIAVVADQHGTPTHANDLAYELLKIALTDDYGIYHCTNGGSCSWFEFACAVLDATGIPCEREAITSDEYHRRFPTSAKRPAYSLLRNQRLEDGIGNEMRQWREALSSFLEHLEELQH
jgi:dTDP-4-dehydrorhamnose reductase